MTVKSAEPQAGRGLLVLLLIVFINIAGFGVVIPLLPFYAQSFGIPAWQVTILFSAYSIGQFIGEPLWGRLSDVWGRKPVLIGTMAAIGVSYVLLAFAPNYWAALALRLLGGIAGGNIAVTQAYVGDITPPEKRTSRLGLLGAVFGCGFIIGPALGGLLVVGKAGSAGFRPPLLTAAALSALAVAGIIGFLRETRHVETSRRQRAELRDALRNPVIGQVMLTTLVATGAFSAMEAIFGLWTGRRFNWGPHEVGLTFAGIGLLSAVMQALFTGWIVRKIGEANTLALGLAIAGASLVAQAFAPNTPVLVAIIPFTVIGISITNPAIAGLVSLASAPEQQGAMLGLNSALGAFARIGGPVVAGILFSSVSVDAPYVFAGLGLFPAAWLGWRINHKLRQASDWPGRVSNLVPMEKG